MKTFLRQSILLLLLVSWATAWLEIRNRWSSGYEATLHIPVRQEVHGWQLVLEFGRPFTELEVFQGQVESLVDNQFAFIVHHDWNKDLPPNQDFPLEFIARHNENDPAALVKATFNGEPVDVGEEPGPEPTDGPAPNTTTTTTTTRKPGEPGEYDYAEVLGKSLLFYEAQRCGKLPGDNRVPWRGDSFLQDGQDNGLDLTGGYFDAGDHVKFGFPMAAMTTIMGWGLVDYEEGYSAAKELENARKALRWSLDYFIKAHSAPTEFYGQCGDGDVDHAFWGRPEEWPQGSARPCWKVTASAPGSDLAGETAAALVTGYLAFKDSDPAYANNCLKHARELYDFANTHRGVYSDSIPNAANFYRSWSGYGDELGWSAAWLYRATGEEEYLKDFESHWEQFGLSAKPLEFSWDDKKAGLQILMAKLTKDPKYTSAAESFCNFIVNEIPRTPKGLAYISQWGSLRHVSNCAFVCLQAADAGIQTEAYREFATKQMHYILGDTGRSFVVGYGVNPPTKPHHRASSCPDRPGVCDWNTGMNNPGPNWQTLTGALVGGPGSNDDYADDRNDYVKNEVATDYNAGFQGAIAGLLKLQRSG